MTGASTRGSFTTQEATVLGSDSMHAQLGTFRDLVEDGLFMRIIEEAEAFNGGSPFTLCRCPALGAGDINMSSAVRNELAGANWIPESGTIEISGMAPADGTEFSIRLRIPRDSGHLAEAHYAFGPEFFDETRREDTLRFLLRTANDLGASFGYVHHARDEIVADTTDPNRFRALTGQRPPLEAGALERQPGRSWRAGRYLIACRWMNLFGAGLAELIGHERLESVPGEVTVEGSIYAIRLYDDPLSYDSRAARDMQRRVREHLRLDELAETASWELVERRPSGEHEHPLSAAPTAAATMELGATERLPLPFWASLYDADPMGLPDEEAFFTAQARQAAGRVLEVGAGTGRLTIPIARTGVPVVTLESSAEAVDALRRRVAAEDPGLQRRTTVLSGELADLDVRDSAPFAAAFIPYRGVNRIAHAASPREFFERVRSVLAPDGVLVFNTFFPPPRPAGEVSAPTPMLRYNGLDPVTGLRFLIYDTVEADPIGQRLSVLRRVLELAEDGRVLSDRFVTVLLRYFYPDELRHLLELAGFRPAIYGGFASEPLIEPSQEVVVVASRV